MSETRTTPLIHAAALAGRLGEPALRLADVRWYLGDPTRGRREFDAGHLPGAVFVDLDHDLSAEHGRGRHPLPEPGALARRMGRLGFGDEHTIVVYDDAGGTVAARLWWMLDRLGHPDVALLDGGLAAWTRVGGELSSETPSHPPTRLTLASQWPDTIDRETIAGETMAIDLVDLRAAERYRGEVEPVDRVPGHIPGARNRPAGDLLDGEGRLLEPGRLRGLLGASVTGSGPPLVMSCGSGVTACFGALAARVAGLPDPLVYPGSYSDWSSAGLPIATGEEPR